jgi:adenine phosphoribosyltransferase
MQPGAGMAREFHELLTYAADFPKKGILFWDVTTILLNVHAFQATIDLFVERYKDMKIDVVAGAYYIVFSCTAALL